MNLTIKEIHRRNADYSDIESLKRRAFPPIEQVPTWLLLLLALRSSVNDRAFYDGKEFCGFLYTAETDKMIFVLFLAVNDKLRSKGYGTAILNWLKENSSGKDISLNIENPYEKADNCEQRLRRKEFYLRNGFHLTGYQHIEKRERYLILSTQHPFILTDYLSTLKELSCGFYHAHIERTGD